VEKEKTGISNEKNQGGNDIRKTVGAGLAPRTHGSETSEKYTEALFLVVCRQERRWWRVRWSQRRMDGAQRGVKTCKAGGNGVDDGIALKFVAKKSCGEQ